jgi:hypothetical protein
MAILWAICGPIYYFFEGANKQVCTSTYWYGLVKSIQRDFLTLGNATTHFRMASIDKLHESLQTICTLIEDVNLHEVFDKMEFSTEDMEKAPGFFILEDVIHVDTKKRKVEQIVVDVDTLKNCFNQHGTIREYRIIAKGLRHLQSHDFTFSEMMLKYSKKTTTQWEDVAETMEKLAECMIEKQLKLAKRALNLAEFRSWRIHFRKNANLGNFIINDAINVDLIDKCLDKLGSSEEYTTMANGFRHLMNRNMLINDMIQALGICDYKEMEFDEIVTLFEELAKD